jgi:hypothetical protein
MMTMKKPMKNEGDFVFRDDANGLWRVVEWQGNHWLYYWAVMTQRWVPLRIVDFDAFMQDLSDLPANRYLPPYQAKLYHALSERWPKPVPFIPDDQEQLFGG